MPLHVGIPYQPYSFLIKKLDDLIVAQNDEGRIQFSGTDAATVIQAAIDALPDVSTYKLTGQPSVTGKRGRIILKDGFYEGSQKLSIPVGSNIALVGETGVPFTHGSPFTIEENYFGGVTFYSKDPEGKILELPRDVNNEPRTSFYLENIELRIKKPASVVDGPAVDLRGFRYGALRNVKIYNSDVDVPNVRYGMDVSAGAKADKRIFEHVEVFGFSSYCIYFYLSHIFASSVSAGKPTTTTAFQIVPLEDNVFISLHPFYANIGILYPSWLTSTRNTIYTSTHFEEVNIAFQSPVGMAYFYNPIFELSAYFTGDIADPTKARVINACFKDDLTKKSENSGTAIGTGAQQAIPHECGFIPTKAQVIVTNIDDGANPYLSADPDATNIYVTAVTGKKYRWEVKG